MGCVYSSVEKEESVRRCRERRRLMKQLMRCRRELAAAHLAYLQSLRNTGATLRQFADDGSVSPLCPPVRARLPRSPLRLPPSPPPLPPFSPDSRRSVEEEADGNTKDKERLISLEKILSPGEELTDTNDGSSGICTPPPLPSWEFWDPFDLPSASNHSSPVPPPKKENLVEMDAMEEENWAETNTDFMEEEENGVNERSVAEVNLVLSSLIEKSKGRGQLLVDDSSSMVSGLTKDTDMAMVVWRNRKTLAGVTRELDDYFLKASAGGTEVISLLESNRSNCLNFASKGKKSKSAKVVSSLSWRWSSRSPLSSKGARQFQADSDPCRSGSHCGTLDKLHAEEQKLYKVVKAEEVAKLRHRRKILLLHKQEAREQDSAAMEKTRTKIDELDNRIRSLQESINGTCISISKLRDEELLPQIITLSSRLLKMWRTMYECHQVQNHVAQQANNVQSHATDEPTSVSHLHATMQLESEVGSWHTAFHKLLKSQREYAHTLNQWVKLTDCLPDNGLCEPSCSIYALCEEWKVAVDMLPDKVTAEAIKSFASVIRSIDLQLMEEHRLKKKTVHLEKKLSKKLEKQTMSLSETEVMYDENPSTGPASTAPSKQKRIDCFKKKVADEKSKYLNSIRTSHAMMLNNLQTGLPNLFQAMTGFAGVCVQAFEGVCQWSATGAAQVT